MELLQNISDMCIADEYMDIGYGFNYFSITKESLKDGDGCRVVLWVSGCSHNCSGCQNPFTHDYNSGKYFDFEAKAELLEYLSNPCIQGITLSGGDPLFKKNRDGIGRLLKEIKEIYPSKDVWLYTGYDFGKDGSLSFTSDTGECFSLPWLDLIDVIVDGKFKEDVRKNDLKNNSDPQWRGSSNQHLWDVRLSIFFNSPQEEELTSLSIPPISNTLNEIDAREYLKHLAEREE